MKKYIFILILFTSCNLHQNRCLKKYNKLKMKCSDIVAVVNDTITIRDTFITQTVSVDSIVISRPIDTILITEDKVKLKILRFYDTLRVQVECEGDTLIRYKTIYKNRLVAEKKGNSIKKYKYILLFIITIIALFMLIIGLRNLFKK